MKKKRKRKNKQNWKSALLCFALSRDTSTDILIYRLSALICMAILQTTLYCTQPRIAILCTTDYLQCSTMPDVTTIDYPLCSSCLYYNRLSALPTIRSALSGDVLQPTIQCALLSFDSTSDYPIYRLSILQPTIRSALSSDTATDCPLCSTLAVDSTSDYPIYQLSI
jgi:hypothetical protein